MHLYCNSKSLTEQCLYFNMITKSDCFKFSKLLVLLDYLYSLKILIEYTFIFILWEISVTYDFEHIESLRIDYAYNLLLYQHLVNNVGSQEHYTGPYPEPDQSNQYHHILCL
jgi:hypothetical protein